MPDLKLKLSPTGVLKADLSVAVNKPGDSPAIILPTLENPAEAHDILAGKEVINSIGKKMTGTYVDCFQYVASVTFSSAISEITDEIVLNLKNATSFSFRYIDVSAFKITVELSEKFTSFNNCFRAGNIDKLKEIEIIGDIGNVTIYNGAFSQRRVLEKLSGVPLDFTKVTTCNECFGACANLTEVRFVEKSISVSLDLSSSSKLSAESAQSVISGLADLTGLTPQTLKLHPDVKERLTDSQRAEIVNKNFTLA